MSKCAPCVESVIRTNGETSRFTPCTEDIAAHTSERLARTGVFPQGKVARIALAWFELFARGDELAVQIAMAQFSILGE